MSKIEYCIDFLTSLVSSFINYLDDLTIVEGVSFLTLLLGILIILIILSNVFGKESSVK